MSTTVLHAAPDPASTARYARAIEASKRIRWDLERDVLRGRQLDFHRKFLPDALARPDRLPFLDAAQQRFFSQVQGRTYAHMFGLVERCISALALDLGRDHALGDQVALEALVRLTDEELKHQALFRRLDAMMAAGMPGGYRFVPPPNAVTKAMLARGRWAVLGLMLHLELVSQAHFRSSMEPDPELSILWKDVFLFHWKEEAQHAIVDELEWRRVHAGLDEAARAEGVAQLVELFAAMDQTVRMQANADADYFCANAGGPFGPAEAAAVRHALARAYQWQYIVTGIEEPRYREVLKSLVTRAQYDRILAAVAPLVAEARA